MSAMTRWTACSVRLEPDQVITKRDVRIFPLLALGGIASSHVAGTVATLRDLKYAVSIERVPYEFQRGGNEMMRIRTA